MPGTLLLDDWRSSVEDQLHQAADQAIATARAAQQATIAPVQQAAQALPQIQAPDPNQVGAALHGYVDQLGQQAQQAAPAVIQLGQDAQQAGAQVLGGAQQATTAALGGAQDAQAQVGDALHQHVNNLLSIGGGAPPVTAINQPPTLGGPQQSNKPTVTTLNPPQAAQADVLGGPPSADTTQTTTTAAPPDRSMGLQDYARAAAQRAGIDPDIFVAQIQQESGFNPSAKSPAGAIGIAQFMPATAAGMKVDPTDPYAALDAAASMDAQNLKKYNGDYSKTLAAYNAGGGAVDQYGGVPPYKETQNYVSTIMGNAKQAAGNAVQGAKEAVGGAASALGTGARAAVDTAYKDISQLPQYNPELTSDEAYSACGPAAAVRFAEKFGRNPTLREATDLAKQVGWTSGGGMAGISSEQKLMSNLGIDTKIVGRDWAAYAQEAQTGNPVTISTPGHYYFADGYNPESGAFHVGRSGLDLKGGSEWMTPAQMENLMGTAQGALFANNPTVPNRGNTTSSNAAAPDAVNAPTTPAAKPPIVMGGMQDANGQPTARGYSGPTLIQTAQDAAGEALGGAGRAVGGAASALGGAAQGAVQGAQQGAVQVAPILGGAASAAGSTVRSVADDLGQAAQGAVNQVQDLNRQTPGTSVVNAAAPVLGGAASELGTNVRNVADQAGQVLGGASDTAQNLVLRQGRTPAEQAAFEEGQRQALGQIVQQGQQPAGPMNAGDVARNAWDLVVNSNPGLPGVSLQDYQHASTVKNDWIQQNNPVYNLPGGRPPEGQMTPASVLGDLTTSIAQQITDPLSMTQFGLLGNVGGGAVGGAVGGRVAAGATERLGPVAAEFLGKVTERLASGGITGGVQNALYAAEQPGASPQTVGMAALQGMGFGAALEGGLTAAAPLVRTIGQAIIDRAPELRTATAQFATSETGALGRPEDVRAEAARQAGEQTAPDEPVRSLPAGGAAGNPYDLPRTAPEPTAAPLSETDVLSHLEQLDLLSTQNDARIADLQNQVAAGTAAPEARAQLTRLQADQAQIDAAHSSIWEHAGAGGDVYARPAAEPLPSPGAVDAGAAQATRGPAPAPAAATGGRGEARTGIPGPPAAREPLARAEPAQPELTGFRAPAPGTEPVAPQPEPPITPTRATPSSSPELDKLNAMYDGKKPAPTASIPDRLQSVADSLTRAFTDRQVDINHAQERYAKNLGRPLRGDEMAAELQRLASDPVAQVKVDEGLKPAIQSVGSDYPALRNYVTLRSNIEVADNLASRTGNPEVGTDRLFSGGLNREQSAKALQDLETQLGPERFAKVQAAADQVTAFNNDLRQRLVQAGVLDEGTAAQLEAQYPNWAKTRILDYMADPAGGQGAGTKLGLSDRGLREYTLKGTERAREDPIASTVAYAHQVERMAMKNEAFNAFLKIDQTGENPMLREVPQSYTPKSNETTMIGFVDGQKQKYVTDNQALGAAINGANVLSTPEWTSAWQKIFRSLATSRNPLFLAGNAALDIPTYVLRSSVREGGPQALPRILGELARGYGDAFQGLFQGEFRGAGSSEFLKGGGGQSGYFTGGEGQTKRAVAEMQRKNVFQIDGWQDLGRLTKDLLTLHPVEALGERIEMGPRVAAMRLAQRRGANPTQAVIDGRTVTVDFSQGGTVTKYLNNFIPFFNVGFQGPAQIARAFRDNPRAFVATVGTLIGIPSAAAEVWNRSDPQRAKDYADVPQYVKDQGVVVMLPGDAPVDAQGNRKPMYAVVKLREWMPFASLAREATDRALGDDSRSWQEMASSIGSGLSPIQAQNVAQVGTEPLGGIPILPAAAQLEMNTDFFRGRTIVTQRADQNASAAAKAITPAIQAIVDRAGINAEIRPSAIDFLVRNQGAGVGGAALSASDLAAGQPSDTAGPTGMPGVGGLIGRFAGNQTGNELQQARDNSLSAEARQALRSNGITTTPGPVSSSVNQIPLKIDEETKYQQLANQYIDQAIRRTTASPDFATKTQVGKQSMIDQAVQGARAKAGNEVLNTIPAGEKQRRLKTKSTAPSAA